MKLIKKKNGAGFLSTYTLNIKLTEAREADFVDSDGNSKELEKIIDTEQKQIIIKLKNI